MIFNAANIKNVHITNNILYVEEDINKIKQRDKNKFRFYKFINKKQKNVDVKKITGTVLRFELFTHNIAHFIYDTFLHFIHFIETCQQTHKLPDY